MKLLHIKDILYRFIRVVLTPFIFLGFLLIGLYFPIAIVCWILTGANSFSKIISLQSSLIIFCWGGEGI